MALKPTSLPRWATAANRIVEPPENGATTISKDAGWYAGKRPPARFMNWFDNLVYQWCAYLDDIENHDLSWTVVQDFNAGITVSNTIVDTAGISSTGNGTAPGGNFIGGATGEGVIAIGGSGGGIGVSAVGTGGNAGVTGTGHAGAAGVSGTGGGTGGAGVTGTGNTTGPGGIFNGGPTNAPGINTTGGGTGPGALCTGGSGGGPGISAVGTNNNNGATCTGHGGAAGVLGTGGSGGGTGVIGNGANGGHGGTFTGQGVGTGVVGTGGASGMGIFGSSSSVQPGIKGFNSSTGRALEIGTGNAEFTGASPAAGANPGANNLACGANQCKAWAYFEIGNNTRTIFDNYNIDDITIDGTGLLGIVTFVRAMANTNYSITWGLGENQRGVFVPPASKTTGGFQFQVNRPMLETIYDLTLVSEHTLHFQVEGRQ